MGRLKAPKTLSGIEITFLHYLTAATIEAAITAKSA
jgi:hypothetical protein